MYPLAMAMVLHSNIDKSFLTIYFPLYVRILMKVCPPAIVLHSNVDESFLTIHFPTVGESTKEGVPTGNVITQ